MNQELEEVRFYVSKKYENYKILLNKIEGNHKLEETLDSLSNRMNKKLEEILEYKNDILYSDKLYKFVFINKMNLYLTLKSLSNLNTKYKLDNSDILYNNEKKNINKVVDIQIDKIATNIRKGKVDLDEIIGIFKLVDLIISVHRNKDLEFKLGSFKNENTDEAIHSFIYGQGFENLNLIYLNSALNLNLRKVESLEEWNEISQLKQFNLWKKKNLDYDESFHEWQNNDKLNKDNYKIPSMDLVDLNENKNIFIETKNYSLNKEANLNLNLKYEPSYLLVRLTNQEKLIKDNSEIFYNINIYDQINSNSFHYNIPIHELKKFYKKIDNKIQQLIKSNSRSTESIKNLKLDININDDNLRVYFELNKKNIIIQDSFKLFIKFESFQNIFKNFQINNIDDNRLSLKR